MALRTVLTYVCKFLKCSGGQQSCRRAQVGSKSRHFDDHRLNSSREVLEAGQVRNQLGRIRFALPNLRWALSGRGKSRRLQHTFWRRRKTLPKHRSWVIYKDLIVLWCCLFSVATGCRAEHIYSVQIQSLYLLLSLFVITFQLFLGGSWL